MTCAVEIITSVYPSGAALETSAVPMVEPAPVLPGYAPGYYTPGYAQSVIVPGYFPFGYPSRVRAPIFQNGYSTFQPPSSLSPAPPLPSTNPFGPNPFNPGAATRPVPRRVPR